MKLYKLMLDVACGTRPYHELETAGAPFRDQEWYQWLAIPPENSYLWTWYPKIGNLDTLVFWRQVRAPVLLVYGERDQLEPVGESLAKIEASLESVKTPYTAVIVPNAQHNLTVQPKPNESFFWWKSAPGFIGLVVAWVQHQTGWKNRFDGVRREGGQKVDVPAEDHFSKVMLTTRPSRYTFPSIPRSNTNVVGASVSGSS